MRLSLATVPTIPTGAREQIETLGALERFLLKHADGRRSIVELAAATGMTPEDVLAVLERLAERGLVAAGSATDAPPYSVRKEGSLPSEALPRSARSTPVSGAPTSSRGPASLPAETQKRIADVCVRLARTNHYELLGVAPAASRDAIRKAYDRKVAEFQAMAAVTDALRAFGKSVRKILDALDVAWSVLSDAESRRAYDADLARKPISRRPAGDSFEPEPSSTIRVISGTLRSRAEAPASVSSRARSVAGESAPAGSKPLGERYLSAVEGSLKRPESPASMAHLARLAMQVSADPQISEALRTANAPAVAPEPGPASAPPMARTSTVPTGPSRASTAPRSRARPSVPAPAVARQSRAPVAPVVPALLPPRVAPRTLALGVAACLLVGALALASRGLPWGAAREPAYFAPQAPPGEGPFGAAKRAFRVATTPPGAPQPTRQGAPARP